MAKDHYAANIIDEAAMKAFCRHLNSRVLENTLFLLATVLLFIQTLKYLQAHKIADYYSQLSYLNLQKNLH
jgi:hypothetical protein